MRVTMALPMGALLALVSACGTERSPDVATAQTPGSSARTNPIADMRDQALKYVRCMRDAGVNLDDPDPTGKITLKPGDKSNPEYPNAFKKCKDLYPQGTLGTVAPFTAEQLATLREYAKCMRDNGVPDFADPGPQGFVTPPKDQVAAARAHVVCAPIIGANPSATAGQG